MSDGEIDYWKRRGLDPMYMYDLADENWENYLESGVLETV